MINTLHVTCYFFQTKAYGNVRRSGAVSCTAGCHTVATVTNYACGWFCMKPWSGRMTSLLWSILNAIFSMTGPLIPTAFPCKHVTGLPSRDQCVFPKPAFSSPMSLSQTLSEVRVNDTQIHTHTEVHVVNFMARGEVKTAYHNARLQPKAVSLSPWPNVTSTLVFLSESQPWSNGKTD